MAPGTLFHSNTVSVLEFPIVGIRKTVLIGSVGGLPGAEYTAVKVALTVDLLIVKCSHFVRQYGII